MPTFQLWDHPDLPLVMATVEPRRRTRDKTGLRPRYVVEVDDPSHADDVVTMLDDLMGERCKGHGVYQAPYADVRAAYGTLLASAEPPRRSPWRPVLRVGALLLGCALLTLSVMAIVLATITSLFLSALAGRSGSHVWFELHVIDALFNRHELVRALWDYARRP